MYAQREFFILQAHHITEQCLKSLFIFNYVYVILWKLQYIGIANLSLFRIIEYAKITIN